MVCQTTVPRWCLICGRVSENFRTQLTASQEPVQACSELAELSQAWPKLSVNVRKAILALIRATLVSKRLRIIKEKFALKS
jgi:hypothetical protein